MLSNDLAVTFSTTTYQKRSESSMTLLVLAIAYIVGVWGISLLVQAGLLGCDLPEWLWVAPLVLLPVTPSFNVWAAKVEGALRWPESAGFVRPRRGIAPGLVVATLLC